MPAPANDLCVNATTISSLPYSLGSIDNTSATESVDDPLVVAMGDGTLAGAAAAYKTLWWKYTPASNQRVKFSMTPTTGMILAVYTGSCGGFVELASWRAVTVDLTAGTTYYIMTGSITNTGHTYQLDAAVSTGPSNQFQTTAQTITTLPFTDSPDLSLATDMSTSNPGVYYKYTAIDSDLMLGFFAYSGSFDVNIEVYDAPVDMYDGNAAAVNVTATNLAIQYPLTPGSTYIFRVYRSSGTAGVASINVQPQPTASVSSKDVLITDDTIGFPACVLDRDTGEPKRFLDLPACEWGDVLDDGTLLIDSLETDTLKLFNRSFNELADLGTFSVSAVAQHPIRMSPGEQVFYVGRAGSGGTNASIRRVDADGTVTNTWTLSAVGLVCLAPNNDGSIVYVGGQTSSANTPIKAWQTSGSFGSDLIAGLGANIAVRDMLVLESSGNIAVLWQHTGTNAVTLKVITPGGSVVGTLTSLVDTTGLCRLAYDPETRETHFWAWTHASGGTSTFSKIDASSVTVVDTFSSREYESGVYVGSVTATPDERFGNSQSCPFIFLRIPIVIPDPSEPCCPCDCPPAKGPGGSPSSAPIETHTGPILPPVDSLEWTPFCAGGGSVPTASDATDVESWVS